MKRILNYTLFAILFCSLLTSCKKEPLSAGSTRFATLTIDNKTPYNAEDLSTTFNGKPFNSPHILGGIMIPAGKGRFMIADKAGKTLLDTMMNFEAEQNIRWTWFSPSEEIKPILVEDKSTAEAQPDADHIKIKLANLSGPALTKPFDAIFYWFDDNFNLIEGGRIDNVVTSFPDQFAEVLYKVPTNYNSQSPIIKLVDHNTQESLLQDDFTTLYMESDKRIITCYIYQPKEYGVSVIGTPYKIDTKVLFLK